jgi:MFS family permease
MNSKELYDKALAQAHRGEFGNAKKLLNQVVDGYPNTPESEDALIGLVELDKMVKRHNKIKTTTTFLIIFGPFALGGLLIATGTPPGVVGFFIVIPMLVFLPILGLISSLFKLSGSKGKKCRGHFADEISKKNEIKKGNARRRYAYLSFILLGLFSLWVSYLTYGAGEGIGGHTPGLLGVIEFWVIIPLAIPAVIFGPFLSLFTNWDDGYLMSMTGLSFLLVVLAGIVSATALPWIFLAYGVACLVICITKGSYNK